jgi:hypothetical protein
MDHRVILLNEHSIDMHIYSFHIHSNILENYWHKFDDNQLNIEYEDYILNNLNEDKFLFDQERFLLFSKIINIPHSPTWAMDRVCCI